MTSGGRFIFMLALSQCDGLRVLSHSPPDIVEEGEVAHLFCQGDGRFDSCTWDVPGGRRCGPLSSTQSVCRAASNIHYTGTRTNCSIRIDGLKREQSGYWNCRCRRT